MEAHENIHKEKVATTKPLGKQRKPVTVALLGFFTFGIYFIYWQYKVNKEIMAYDESIKSSAILSALAAVAGYILGLLFYLGIVSAYKTCERAVRMMDNYGGQDRGRAASRRCPLCSRGSRLPHVPALLSSLSARST